MAKIGKMLSRGCCLAALCVGHAYGSFQVTVDTTFLNGLPAALAFDLTDGNGATDSTVSISGFSSDGTLGGNSSTGGAAGTLPAGVTLSDTSFLNEYCQQLTLGNSITFRFETSGAFGGGTPDAFSFFILNPDPDCFSPSLVATDDPTGSGALFLYNIGVTDPIQPEVFTAQTIPGDDQGEPQPVPVGVTSIPEPGALALAMAALLALGFMRAAVRRAPLRRALTA